MNINGIHHVKLTVSDLEKSKDFYRNILGFKVVAEYPNFVMFFCKSFYLGITNHTTKGSTSVFNEFNVGLDHLSFDVSERKDLNEAIILFNKKDITHGEIEKLSNGVLVLAFRDPDNIQLELSWKK